VKPQKDPENREGKTLSRFADFKNAHVLEVGCGEGRLTWKYARGAKFIAGIDPDHDALRVAQADGRMKDIQNAQFTNASGNHIPFSKETFDIAILAWSL
jgi:ubiquinone/menaquinone biosynthesis C-methylase UbiE